MAIPTPVRQASAASPKVGSAVGHPAADHGHALSEAQLEAIAQARLQGKIILRAARVATMSGWCTGIFAGFTLIGGLFGLPALLLGIGFMACAVIELKGARSLRLFDLNVPARLAWNQAALAAMLCVYSLWSIGEAVWGAGPYESYMAAGGQMADAVKPIAHLHSTITILFYALVIVCSIIAQGCAALYYATRRAHIAAFVTSTPAWVLDLLRAAHG